MFLLRFQINYDYDNSHSKRDKRVIFGGGIVQTVLEAQLKSPSNLRNKKKYSNNVKIIARKREIYHKSHSKRGSRVIFGGEVV